MIQSYKNITLFGSTCFKYQFLDKHNGRAKRTENQKRLMEIHRNRLSFALSKTLMNVSIGLTMNHLPVMNA